MTSVRFFCACTAILFSTIGHAQTKITLKKFEDPYKQGVKEIVFEYEVKVSGQDGGQSQKVTKVFDIEANNPFNNMGLKTTNAFYRDNNIIMSGSEVLLLDDTSISALLNQFDVPESGLPNDFKENVGYGYTWTSIREGEKHMVLTNNLSLYDKDGYQVGKGGKFGSITVLDNKGNVTYTLENIGSDIYENAISENSRYLAYAYGGPTHDLSYEGKRSGLRIINIETDQIFFEQSNRYVFGISVIYDMMIISISSEIGEHKIVLDALTGELYGPEKFAINLERFKFMQTDGTVLEKKDLKRIK